MCGIAAAVGPDDHLLARQLDALNAGQKHRGPDVTSSWKAGGIALGKTRLAINDLSPRGNQPFTSDDGPLIFVFKDEIYNWVDLKTSYHLNVSSANDGAIILPRGFARAAELLHEYVAS
jgi:asparagine synthase (glutamine-hydrolysing)